MLRTPRLRSQLWSVCNFGLFVITVYIWIIISAHEKCSKENDVIHSKEHQQQTSRRIDNLNNNQYSIKTATTRKPDFQILQQDYPELKKEGVQGLDQGIQGLDQEYQGLRQEYHSLTTVDNKYLKTAVVGVHKRIENPNLKPFDSRSPEPLDYQGVGPDHHGLDQKGNLGLKPKENHEIKPAVSVKHDDLNRDNSITKLSLKQNTSKYEVFKSLNRASSDPDPESQHITQSKTVESNQNLKLDLRKAEEPANHHIRTKDQQNLKINLDKDLESPKYEGLSQNDKKHSLQQLESVQNLKRDDKGQMPFDSQKRTAVEGYQGVKLQNQELVKLVDQIKKSDLNQELVKSVNQIKKSKLIGRSMPLKKEGVARNAVISEKSVLKPSKMKQGESMLKQSESRKKQPELRIKQFESVKKQQPDMRVKQLESMKKQQPEMRVKPLELIKKQRSEMRIKHLESRIKQLEASIKQHEASKQISLFDDDRVERSTGFTFMYSKTCVKVIGSVPEYKKDVFLFIGIHTGPDMVHRRQTLRQTYLSLIDQKNETANVLYRFILGWPREDLIMENTKYNDIVFINQTERYKPYDSILPYKHATILNIAARLDSKWVMKTDDDSMINLNVVLEKVQYFYPNEFYGQCHYKDYPIRNKYSIWYISEFFWPGDSPYPPYCVGAGYFLPNKGFKCAVKIIGDPSYKFFPLEDVETGGLMKKCNITAVNINGIYGEPEPSKPYFLIQHHLRSAQSLKFYWSKIVKTKKHLEEKSKIVKKATKYLEEKSKIVKMKNYLENGS